jgi:hypothetical protein
MINFCKLPVINGGVKSHPVNTAINVKQVLWVSTRTDALGEEIPDECDVMMEDNWCLKIALSVDEVVNRIHEASKEWE